PAMGIVPDRFVLFEAGPEGRAAAFTDPQQVIVAHDAASVPAALAALRSATEAGLWLAGFASYELGYVLEPRLATLLPEGRETPLLCFAAFAGPDDDALARLQERSRREEASSRLSG